MSRKGVNRFPDLIPIAKPIVIPQPVQVVPQMVPQMVPVGPVEVPKVKDSSKVKTLDELRTKMNVIETKLDLLLMDPDPKLNKDPQIEFKEVSDSSEDLVSKARSLARAKSKGVKVPEHLPAGAEFRVSSGNLMDEALKLKYKSKKREKSSK